MIVENHTVRIASWKERFVAGIIDCAIISSSVAVPIHLAVQNENPLMILPCLATYAYYTISEYKYGQTIGKKALNLRTTSLDGSKISLKQSLINSFGKAFLLVIDFAVGVLVIKNAKQRLFNKLSNTIVTKTEKSQKTD